MISSKMKYGTPELSDVEDQNINTCNETWFFHLDEYYKFQIKRFVTFEQ